MKKTTFIVACILLTQVGIFSTIQASDNTSEEIFISFKISQPIITFEEGFTKLSLREDSLDHFIPGHPFLPTLKEIHVLPFGSTIESIEYDQINTNTETIETPLIPYQTPLPIHIQQQSTPLYVTDETIYSRNAFYPENPYIVSTNTGIYQGTRVTFLNIVYYPIQYNPVEQQLIWTEKCDITISIKQATKSIAISNSNDLAIICPAIFAQELQNLANHKGQNELRTTIQTTEEIYSNYPGRDSAEQIKYYIHDAVKNEGVSYVLLVGNVELLPMRASSIEFYNDDSIITDLYYADVFDYSGSFSSWDTNGNDKFSEYSWSDGLIDFVDAYPDVSVGRLPCKNTEEVKIVVNKIITYEETTAQQSWFNRILLMGGDTFPNHGVLEGELVTDLIADSMTLHQFEPVRLWTSTNTFNPFIINKEISKGAGFISYSGHGYEQGFGTSRPNQEDRVQYFSPYLYGLFNGMKLPVIFFDACSTTKLDFNVEESLYWYPEPLSKFFTFLEGDSYEMDTLFPCFSWQLVKKQFGGSIASIGSTRVAFTGVDETGPHWGAGYLNSRFFENYSPGKTLGELFNNAQIDYLNHIGKELITIEEFVLIGDPSLQLGGFN